MLQPDQPCDLKRHSCLHSAYLFFRIYNSAVISKFIHRRRPYLEPPSDPPTDGTGWVRKRVLIGGGGGPVPPYIDKSDGQYHTLPF